MHLCTFPIRATCKRDRICGLVFVKFRLAKGKATIEMRKQCRGQMKFRFKRSFDAAAASTFPLTNEWTKRWMYFADVESNSGKVKRCHPES